MKQKTSSLRRWVCSAAVAISGCSNAASVGKDSCIGENIVCASDVPVKGYALPTHNWPDGIHVLDAQEVVAEPFYRRSDGGDAGVVFGGQVAAGPNGSFWLATALKDSVLVEHISSEGVLLESASVSAPSRATLHAGPDVILPPSFRIEVDAELRPMVWLHYVRDWNDSVDEFVLFGADLQSPVRFELEEIHSPEHAVAVVRTAADRLVIRGAHQPTSTENESFVEAVDATGRVLWRQTELHDNTLYSASALAPLATLPSGELMTASTVPIADSVYAHSPQGIPGFLDLDSEGNVVAAGGIVSPSRLAIASIVIARDGRRLLAGTRGGAGAEVGGDLAVVRFTPDGKDFDSWSILREGDRALQPLGLAVDAGDDVIVATVWQERPDYSQASGGGGQGVPVANHPLLCRLSHDHDRDACFEVVSERPLFNGHSNVLSLVSSKSGVAVVASLQGLDRVDLPEP